MKPSKRLQVCTCDRNKRSINTTSLLLTTFLSSHSKQRSGSKTTLLIHRKIAPVGKCGGDGGGGGSLIISPVRSHENRGEVQVLTCTWMWCDLPADRTHRSFFSNNIFLWKTLLLYTWAIPSVLRVFVCVCVCFCYVPGAVK